MNRFSHTFTPQKGVCASVSTCASIRTYTVGLSWAQSPNRNPLDLIQNNRTFRKNVIKAYDLPGMGLQIKYY